MSKQTINIGASPNDGTGTPLRTSFDYTNQNFTELYTAVGPSGNNIVVPGNATITGDLTVDTSTLKVDSANDRVGIGIASPAAGKLHVNGMIYGTNTSGQGLILFRTTDPVTQAASPYIKTPVTSGYSADAVYGFWYQNCGISNPAFECFAITTNSSERYRIDGSGIATWSNVGGVAGTAMTLNSTGLGIGLSPSGGDAGSVYSAGSVLAAGGLTAHQTNRGVLGYGSNETTIRSYGATAGTGFITFRVAGGGASTDTEAGRFDASGNLLIATTTANGRVAVDADLAVYNGMAVKNTGTTYGASSFFFRFINSSGVTAGSIQHTAVTTTNYSTTSDSRLKESKGISTDTSVIDNTIVRDFVWKADGSTDRGVFAQEAQSVKPRAISAGSDDLTEDGNIKTPWSVDYSKYVPDLIVYCQQLKKQVVELTARVQTLEAR